MIEIRQLVIAWFGGQLRINVPSKILKFFCNCPSLWVLMTEIDTKIDVKSSNFNNEIIQ